SIISSFSAIIDFVFSILIALYIDYRITLIMLIFLPLIAYISHQTAQSLKKHSTVLLEHSANVNNLLFETINSIEAIKLNNYQNKQVDIVSGGLTAFVSSFLKKNKSIVYFAENLSAIARLNSVVLLLIAGVFIFMGELTVGTYVALSQYMLKIVGNVTFFSSIAVQLKPVEVSVERIREFFSYPIEADSGHTQLDVPIKQVKIVDVSYNYNGTKQVLQNLSLQLNAGKHYRLSGKNGSGKSTLLKIISGLYSADAGELFYNSISHRDIGKISLRNRIGFVTHQCHLFKGTILDNVFLETAYNQSRLESVLRKYGIETYVNDFKEGLQTEVKHGGTNLSAGQRQFVSFLRAVLSDKDILFFDEPLSNVDAKTQKKMIEVIGDINDKIVVVISHSSAFDKYIQIDIDEVMEVSSQLEDFQ
ncbi:ABC transporter ATP-binding protein, partial [Alkaliphilus sp. AH-315-G20]|nr:ABC transporter ATP-binding protein [Alkaliphilus sp. AH-315-G20]